MSTTAVDPEEIARELFGVHASATPLHGERDLNFRLEVATSRHVLKIKSPLVIAQDDCDLFLVALDRVLA
jgi:Ser/Thr protein kinase RdoA (MazF antagonist)